MTNILILLVFLLVFIFLMNKLIKMNYISYLNNQIKLFIKSNSLYWIVIVVVSVLAYGFTLTNYSIGVDDEAADRYYNGNGLLAQGRFGAYILKIIFNSYKFIPFWRDFLAVIVLIGAVTIWSMYFTITSEQKISRKSTLIFSTIVISCPVIAEIFIFMTATIENNLMLFLTAGSLILFYEWYFKNKNIYLITMSILMLTFSIALGEASAPIFLCGCFMGIFLICYTNKYNIGFKGLSIYAMSLSGVLLSAIIFKSIIAKILLKLTKTPASGYTSGYILWDFSDLKTSIYNFIKNIIPSFSNNYNLYLHIKLFVFSMIILFLICLYLTIKNNKHIFMAIYICITLSCISLIIITGNLNMPQRSMIIYSIYIGFTFLVLFDILNGKNKKILLGVIVCLIVLNQSKQMNLLFFNDYKRYLLDVKTVNDIQRGIEEETGEFTPTKPVVFLGVLYDYGLPKGDVIGHSILRWDRMFGDIDRADRIYGFCDMLGYKYTQATHEQIENAKADAVDMSTWPQKESIKELDDYIIVKMGNIPIEKYKLSKEEFDKNIIKGNMTTSSWIDNISIEDNILNINGWAIFNDIDSKNTKIRIALKSDFNQYIIQPMQIFRPEVSRELKRGINYDNSGFNLTNYDISQFAKGEYELNILIESGKSSMIIKPDNYIKVVVN